MACVGAIASTSASFPAYVYRGTPGGRQELPDHPVARLTRRPNQWQTWPDFLEWWLAQTLLHGNGVAEIEHDGAGRPVALLPIPWGNVSPVMLAGGRLALDVVAYQAPWGHAAQRRRLLPGEFIHLKDRSDDGMIGRSRLSRAREVIGGAMALQEFTGAQWHNQITPSGALKFPQRLVAEQRDRIRADLDNKATGARHAGKVLILEQGVEWQALSVSPEDAEVLASRRFTVEELCRLFQVPPPIVQDLSHGTFTNSREAGRWFAQFTLSPWCRKIEASSPAACSPTRR
jgi:HK97 family phage portal protein